MSRSGIGGGGGADTFTVNDLRGTNVTQLNIDFGGLDGASDFLIVDGTDGNDNIRVDGVRGAVSVAGLGVPLNITGADVLSGEDGRTMTPGRQRHVLASHLSADAIFLTEDGGDGNDVLIGGKGDDILLGGTGDDILIGGLGQDVLDGGDGNDVLYGNAGDDTLLGGAGDDTPDRRAGSGFPRRRDRPQHPDPGLSGRRGGTGGATRMPRAVAGRAGRRWSRGPATSVAWARTSPDADGPARLVRCPVLVGSP